MAKGKGKKSKNKLHLAGQLNTSKKVKRKIGKKKKRSKMNVASESAIGIATSSMSDPHVSSSPAIPTTNITSAYNVQANDRDNGSSDLTSGFIFMCNGATKAECYRYRVFGLPRGQIETVKKIKCGVMLFLFDTELKLLYGIYEATCGGELSLEPAAFSGRFPAQVRFHIFKDCIPLHERDFKNAIKENYNGRKFNQELNDKQVKALSSLFRPLPSQSPASAGLPLLDGAILQYLQTRVMEEKFTQSSRHPHPRDPCLSGSLHPSGLPPLHPQSVHLPPRSVYTHNGTETHGLCVRPPTDLAARLLYGHNEIETPRSYVQPPLEPQRICQQSVPPHGARSYYLADAHQPYLPEPVLSSQDTYRRYGALPEMVQQTPAEGSGHHTSLLPREQNINLHSGNMAGYNAQAMPSVAASHVPLAANSLAQYHHTLLPREQNINWVSGNMAGYNAQATPSVAASHVPLAANSLAQYHVAPPPANVQGEIPAISQSNYGFPTNGAAASWAYVDSTQGQGPQSISSHETNLPASYYSLAGGNPAHL